MPNEVKITAIISITQCLCSSEIRVREISIVDDICLTAHGAQLQQIPFAEDLCIDAFIGFKMEPVLRIIFMPCISPAITGTFAEAERNDLLHQWKKEILSRKFLHAGRV